MPLGCAQDFGLYLMDLGNCKSPSSDWFSNLTLATLWKTDCREIKTGERRIVRILIIGSLIKENILKSSHNSGDFRMEKKVKNLSYHALKYINSFIQIIFIMYLQCIRHFSRVRDMVITGQRKSHISRGARFFVCFVLFLRLFFNWYL